MTSDINIQKAEEELKQMEEQQKMADSQECSVDNAQTVNCPERPSDVVAPKTEGLVNDIKKPLPKGVIRVEVPEESVAVVPSEEGDKDLNDKLKNVFNDAKERLNIKEQEGKNGEKEFVKDAKEDLVKEVASEIVNMADTGAERPEPPNIQKPESGENVFTGIMSDAKIEIDKAKALEGAFKDKVKDVGGDVEEVAEDKPDVKQGEVIEQDESSDVDLPEDENKVSVYIAPECFEKDQEDLEQELKVIPSEKRRASQKHQKFDHNYIDGDPRFKQLKDFIHANEGWSLLFKSNLNNQYQGDHYRLSSMALTVNANLFVCKELHKLMGMQGGIGYHQKSVQEYSPEKCYGVREVNLSNKKAVIDNEPENFSYIKIAFLNTRGMEIVTLDSDGNVELLDSIYVFDPKLPNDFDFTRNYHGKYGYVEMSVYHGIKLRYNDDFSDVILSKAIESSHVMTTEFWNRLDSFQRTYHVDNGPREGIV